MKAKGRKFSNKKYYRKNREIILAKRKLKYQHTITLNDFETPRIQTEVPTEQEIQEYCRLCAVLRYPEEIKCNIDDVEHKLIACCNWNSYRDHPILPKNVCISCFLQLEQCCFFRDSVSRAQQKLNDLIGLDVVDKLIDNNENPSENALESIDEVQVKLEEADGETDIGTVVVSELKIENDSEIGDDNCDSNYANYDSDKHLVDDELDEEVSVDVQNDKTNSDKTISNAKKTKRKNSTKKSKSIKSKCANRMIEFNIKNLLSLQDVNEDGTVKPEKMQELNLYNWEAVAQRCHLCKEEFCTQSELYTHLISIHSNKVIKYVCTICPDETQFTSGRYYREHITKYHHPHLTFCCHKCQKFFYESHKLRKHIKWHPRKPKVSVCTTCGKEFSYYRNLDFHMLTHLPVDLQPQFECFLCIKILKSHPSLKQHMKYHTGISKTNICEQCGKAFMTAYKLKKHMSIHSDERPFTCEICKKTFKTSANLRKHARIHQDFKPCVCDVCGHRTLDKGGLKMHIARHHTHEAPFSCNICGKKYYCAKTIKKHQKTSCLQSSKDHHRSFACNLCDFRAVKQSALQRHHKHIHLDHRPHACNLCDYRTYSKHNLRLHTSRRHRDAIVQSTSAEQK